MEKRSYEGMTIRVPINFAKELKQLKEEEDLPTIGSALQVYIETIKIERLESKLSELESAIQEINQVIRVNQAATILNTSMITVLMKAITPEKITDDPEGQKVIKEAIKRLESNQAMIVSVGKAGLDQAKKFQKKHPQKEQKTQGNRIKP